MTEAGLILFDCDGTLMDSHHHIIAVMRKCFVECGFPPPDDAAVAPLIGLSLRLAVARLLPDESAPTHASVEACYRRLYRVMPVSYALFPGVRETLRHLRARGYWLGVVTGKSLAGLERTLERFGLGEYFLVRRTADQCPSKPHPAMVAECMAEMGVKKSQTTVVGDALLDMQLAQSAGVRGIGVSFGVADAEALGAAGASVVVDAFSDLLVHFPPLHNLASGSTMRP